MSISGLPSTDDPRLKELLAKALAPPKAEPVKPATEGVLNLEALKREVSKAKAWIAENADEWRRLCEPAPAPAPASPEPVREGGGLISRFFRRIVDWFKRGFSRLREWLSPSKAAVEAPSGANDSAPKPASNSAPPQSVETTETPRATEKDPAPPPATASDTRGEVVRELLSHLYRHVTKIPGNDVPVGSEYAVLRMVLGAQPGAFNERTRNGGCHASAV